MKEDAPLVNKSYLLEKFPGKGGWTYAEIPEIAMNRSNPFGWVTVKGFIDRFELKQVKLMPMGNGHLFLPVRAEIRKKIKKEAGDAVKVVLYIDNSAIEITEEIVACFQQEDKQLLVLFKNLPKSRQKTWLEWIYKAPKEVIKAQRIAHMMRELEQMTKSF
jgi:hypothetical protein